MFVCVFLGRGLRSLLIVSQQKNGDEANVRTDGPGYPHVVCQPLSDQNHLGDGHQSTPVLPGQEADQSEHLFYFPNRGGWHTQIRVGWGFVVLSTVLLVKLNARDLIFYLSDGSLNSPE